MDQEQMRALTEIIKNAPRRPRRIHRKQHVSTKMVNDQVVEHKGKSYHIYDKVVTTRHIVEILPND
jgi:hypothetical protein